MVDMINPRVEKIMETTLPQSREFQLRVITNNFRGGAVKGSVHITWFCPSCLSFKTKGQHKHSLTSMHS